MNLGEDVNKIVFSKIRGKHSGEDGNRHTVNSTSDYTFWALYRSYFDEIRANTEQQE
jgi:hypothetical protein